MAKRKITPEMSSGPRLKDGLKSETVHARQMRQKLNNASGTPGNGRRNEPKVFHVTSSAPSDRKKVKKKKPQTSPDTVKAAPRDQTVAAGIRIARPEPIRPQPVPDEKLDASEIDAIAAAIDAQDPTETPKKSAEPPKSAEKPAKKAKKPVKREVEEPENNDIGPELVSPDISDEKIERNKREAAREKAIKKEERRQMYLGIRFLLVLASYVVIMGATLLGLFFFWLPHHQTAQTKDFAFQLGTEKADPISWKLVIKEGVYYVDLTLVADYCNLATTGDNITQRFVSKETGQDAVFTVGDGVAVLNGVNLRMEGGCFENEDHLFVPINFINHSFDGVNIALDTSKNKITVTRTTDADGKEMSVTFPFVSEHGSESQPIRFYDLDYELREQINLLYEINTGKTIDDDPDENLPTPKN